MTRNEFKKKILIPSDIPYNLPFTMIIGLSFWFIVCFIVFELNIGLVLAVAEMLFIMSSHLVIWLWKRSQFKENLITYIEWKFYKESGNLSTEYNEISIKIIEAILNKRKDEQM